MYADGEIRRYAERTRSSATWCAPLPGATSAALSGTELAGRLLVVGTPAGDVLVVLDVVRHRLAAYPEGHVLFAARWQIQVFAAPALAAVPASAACPRDPGATATKVAESTSAAAEIANLRMFIPPAGLAVPRPCPCTPEARNLRSRR